MKQIKFIIVLLGVLAGIAGITMADHIIHVEFMKGFTVVMLLILLKLLSNSNMKNLTD